RIQRRILTPRDSLLELNQAICIRSNVTRRLLLDMLQLAHLAPTECNSGACRYVKRNNCKWRSGQERHSAHKTAGRCRNGPCLQLADSASLRLKRRYHRMPPPRGSNPYPGESLSELISYSLCRRPAAHLQASAEILLCCPECSSDRGHIVGSWR